MGLQTRNRAIDVKIAHTVGLRQGRSEFRSNMSNKRPNMSDGLLKKGKTKLLVYYWATLTRS